MSKLGARSSLLALVVALAALVAILPRHRLTAAAVAAAAAALVIFGPWALQGFPQGAMQVPVPVPTTAAAAPGFSTNDGLSAFVGGSLIRGDSVDGSRSREIVGGQSLDMAALTGLRRGRRYVVQFWAKPLEPILTLGRVGDTTGRGWSAAAWSLKPEVRWQRVRVQLIPTADTEALTLLVDSGSTVRIDHLSVRPGRLIVHVHRPAPIPPAIVQPSYHAGDAAPGFAGGATVAGGVSGRSSRLLLDGQFLELPALTGLRSHRVYTVVFFVKTFQSLVANRADHA